MDSSTICPDGLACSYKRCTLLHPLKSVVPDLESEVSKEKGKECKSALVVTAEDKGKESALFVTTEEKGKDSTVIVIAESGGSVKSLPNEEWTEENLEKKLQEKGKEPALLVTTEEKGKDSATAESDGPVKRYGLIKLNDFLSLLNEKRLSLPNEEWTEEKLKCNERFEDFDSDDNSD